jgi:hypothetical protein
MSRSNRLRKRSRFSAEHVQHSLIGTLFDVFEHQRTIEQRANELRRLMRKVLEQLVDKFYTIHLTSH